MKWRTGPHPSKRNSRFDAEVNRVKQRLGQFDLFEKLCDMTTAEKSLNVIPKDFVRDAIISLLMENGGKMPSDTMKNLESREAAEADFRAIGERMAQANKAFAPPGTTGTPGGGSFFTR